MIPLQNVAVREVLEKTKSFCFEIYSTNSETIKAWKQGNDKVNDQRCFFLLFSDRRFCMCGNARLAV